MAQVTVTINSREYGIACGDGQEAHIIKLSRMLDEKAKQLTAGNGHINENMLLAMVGLLLADELEDAKKGVAPSSKTETQIVEKIVEVEKPVEKIVEKIVEVEKPVEKIVEIEKIVEVAKDIDLSGVDEKLATAISQTTENLKQLINEIEHL